MAGWQGGGTAAAPDYKFSSGNQGEASAKDAKGKSFGMAYKPKAKKKKQKVAKKSGNDYA